MVEEGRTVAVDFTAVEDGHTAATAADFMVVADTAMEVTAEAFLVVADTAMEVTAEAFMAAVVMAAAVTMAGDMDTASVAGTFFSLASGFSHFTDIPSTRTTHTIRTTRTIPVTRPMGATLTARTIATRPAMGLGTGLGMVPLMIRRTRRHLDTRIRKQALRL